MPAPNIINSTTVLGKRAYSILTTSMANVVTNGATSGNLIKISELSITNVSNLVVTTNVVVGRGTTLHFLAGTLSIPATSILTVVSRDSAFYMEEGDYLQANCSLNANVFLATSYEVTA